VNRSSAERVRALIGESIPVGQTAAVTMFSDEEIEDFLEQGFDDIHAAAYWGWMEKAANYAQLVNTNEGNAARELSDLHRQAMRMADRYVAYVPTPGRGRTRLGKIVRETS
jgi:hypothetical protein